MKYIPSASATLLQFYGYKWDFPEIQLINKKGYTPLSKENFYFIYTTKV